MLRTLGDRHGDSQAASQGKGPREASPDHKDEDAEAAEPLSRDAGSVQGQSGLGGGGWPAHPPVRPSVCP